MGILKQSSPMSIKNVEGLSGMFNKTKLIPNGLVRLTLTTNGFLGRPAELVNVIVGYCAKKGKTNNNYVVRTIL